MAIVKNLIVDEWGAHIGKYSERLKVTKAKETLQQAPLLHLKSVMILGKGVSISSDAVGACAERGIPIHYMFPMSTADATLYSAGLSAPAMTRRAQLRAYESVCGLRVALAFAQGKVSNQAKLLKYMVKNYKESEPELFGQVWNLATELLQHEAQLSEVQAMRVDEVRERIMGIEGHAAQRYWAGVRLLLRAELDWPGRETRGATDLFNQALNYGYGVLYRQVKQVLLIAGLDPYAGFLHADRPGKPSLVLDFIEEFRQQVVDRTIIGLVNQGFVLKQEEDGGLEAETRRLIADHVLKRLDGQVPYEGKRHRLGNVLQMQARHLATFLRGERESYEAFVGNW